MPYLFIDLYFTSATNTWIILESLDSPDKQDAFVRGHQGLAPDGLCTRTAQYKRVLCVWREMDGIRWKHMDRWNQRDGQLVPDTRQIDR